MSTVERRGFQPKAPAFIYLYPRRLRAQAHEHLDSARILVDAGLCEHATGLAFRAADLVLKARYCVQQGIVRLSSRGEELSLLMNDPLTPAQLASIVTLSDGPVSVTGDPIGLYETLRMRATASRYVGRAADPLDRALTPDEVGSVLQDIEDVAAQLVLFEVIERLMLVELELSDSATPFTLFAVGRDLTHRDKFNVLAAAPWYGRDTGTVGSPVRRLTQLIDTVLDDELRCWLEHVTLLAAGDPLLRAYQRFPATRHRVAYVMREHQAGGITIPDSYIITNDVTIAQAPLVDVSAAVRQRSVVRRN
jgi:hypothetical protein